MKSPLVRPVCSGDLEALEDIDFECSLNPFVYDQWAEIIQDTKKLVVGVDADGVRAFSVLRPTNTNVEIVRFCTYPSHRGRFDKLMLEHVRRWSKERSSKTITFIVNEVDLHLHLLLKELGYICLKSKKEGLLFIQRIS